MNTIMLTLVFLSRLDPLHDEYTVHTHIYWCRCVYVLHFCFLHEQTNVLCVLTVCQQSSPTNPPLRMCVVLISQTSHTHTHTHTHTLLTYCIYLLKWWYQYRTQTIFQKTVYNHMAAFIKCCDLICDDWLFCCKLHHHIITISEYRTLSSSHSQRRMLTF